MIDSHPSRVVLIAIGVIAPLALCLLGGYAALMESVWLPRIAALQPGYVSWVCASVRPTRDFRVALWWGSPISGRTGLLRKPFVQPNMVCGLAPWLPVLQRAGHVESSE